MVDIWSVVNAIAAKLTGKVFTNSDELKLLLQFRDEMKMQREFMRPNFDLNDKQPKIGGYAKEVQLNLNRLFQDYEAFLLTSNDTNSNEDMKLAVEKAFLLSCEEQLTSPHYIINNIHQKVTNKADASNILEGFWETFFTHKCEDSSKLQAAVTLFTFDLFSTLKMVVMCDNMKKRDNVGLKVARKPVFSIFVILFQSSHAVEAKVNEIGIQVDELMNRVKLEAVQRMMGGSTLDHLWDEAKYRWLEFDIEIHDALPMGKYLNYDDMIIRHFLEFLQTSLEQKFHFFSITARVYASASELADNITINSHGFGDLRFVVWGINKRWYLLVSFFDKIMDGLCLQMQPDPCKIHNYIGSTPSVQYDPIIPNIESSHFVQFEIVKPYQPLLKLDPFRNVFERLCDNGSNKNYRLIIAARPFCDFNSPLDKFLRNLNSTAPMLEHTHVKLLIYRSIGEVFCRHFGYSTIGTRQKVITEFENTMTEYQKLKQHQLYFNQYTLIKTTVIMLRTLDENYAKQLYHKYAPEMLEHVKTQLNKFDLNDSDGQEFIQWRKVKVCTAPTINVEIFLVFSLLHYLHGIAKKMVCCKRSIFIGC